MIFFLLLPAIQCLIVRSSYFEILKEIQQDPIRLSLFLQIEDQDEISEKAVSLLEQFETKYSNVCNLFVLNCDQLVLSEKSHIPTCQQQIPRGIFIVPTVNGPQEHQITIFSLDELNKSFQKLAPQRWDIIKDDQEYQSYFANNQKSIIILYCSEAPIWWYEISYHFVNQLKFGLVNDSEEYLKVFEYKDGKHQQVQYKGAKRFQSLRSFLQKFAKVIDKKNAEKQQNNVLEHKQNNTGKWIIEHVYNERRSDYVKVCNSLGMIEIVDIQRQDIQMPQLWIYPYGRNTGAQLLVGSHLGHLIDTMLELINNKLERSQLVLVSHIKEILSSDRYIVVLFESQESEQLIPELILQTMANNQEYSQELKFYQIREGDSDLLKQFQITKTPFITSLYVSQGKVEQGDLTTQINYQNVLEFLDQIILKIKLPKKLQNPKTQKEFEILCQQQKLPCVILFSRHEIDIDAVTKSQIKVKNKYVWMHVDPKCQNKILQKYQIPNPGLILYDHQELRVSVMNEKLNIQSKVFGIRL
ncbi:hypothetical protein pb186bvf_000618 [Paramecium bursaria]